MNSYKRYRVVAFWKIDNDNIVQICNIKFILTYLINVIYFLKKGLSYSLMLVRLLIFLNHEVLTFENIYLYTMSDLVLINKSMELILN